MKIYTDGLTIGKNPSNVGGGYCITKENGDILEINNSIRKNPFTSNEAELLGALRATELASNGDEIITDSMNTYYWIKNGKSKARPDLNELMLKAKNNIKLKNLTLVQKPREENLAGIYIQNNF